MTVLTWQIGLDETICYRKQILGLGDKLKSNMTVLTWQIGLGETLCYR